LCYFNDKDDITQGAHYINITWNKETRKYDAYNYGKTIYTFNSIEEFIKSNTYRIISMTTLY